MGSARWPAPAPLLGLAAQQRLLRLHKPHKLGAIEERRCVGAA
jgi:hypothetical protein